MNATILEASGKWNHAVFVYDWLVSLSIMSSSFIHGVAYERISFFLTLKQICVCVCVSHFLYPIIYQWTFRLLPPLGYCDNDATNVGVQISLRDPVFSSFGYIFKYYFDTFNSGEFQTYTQVEKIA